MRAVWLSNTGMWDASDHKGNLQFKIFITGAAGFIATHLIEKLEALGHECWGCDISLSPNPRIRRIDVNDFGGMERMIQFINPHIVIHAANFGNRYPEHFSHSTLWSSNLIGTENILELQRRFGFDLIYTSSSEVYGKAAPSPVYEHYEGDWWYNDYAASKWVSEKLIQRQLDENQNLRAIILRLFGVYGPSQPSTKDNSVVAQFIHKIKNGQPIEIHDCQRCFLYVDDCVRAIIAAVNKVYFTDSLKVMNVGTTEKVWIRDLAETIAELTGKEIVESNKESVLVGVQEKEPSVNLIAETLQWEPTTKLRDGLRSTIYHVPKERLDYKPYGLFVSVDGEQKKHRRLACAERCADEELIMEDK